MTPLRDPIKVERGLVRALAAATVLAALMSLTGIFLLTLGFDEAWILLGIDGIIHPLPGDMAVAPLVSNGGFFAIGELAVSAIAGKTLWAHRLFVFLCMAGVVALVMRRARKHTGSWTAALIAPAVLLGLPGTLVLAASGHATAPAFLLLLGVVELWEVGDRRRWIRWIVCGALAGLAAASRLETVMLLPALLIGSLLEREGRRERLIDAVIAAVVGGVVLVACMMALSHAAAVAGLDSATVTSMTGVRGAFLDYPRLLNKWVIGESFMTPALLVLATVVGWLLTKNGDRAASSAPALLILCGWLLWMAWIARSPIPHLRYLWPALACFAVVLGLGLARLHAWGVAHEEPVARIASLVLALTCIVTGLGSTLRDLAQGDANILSWEWSRETPLDYFRRFQHLSDQRAAAQYLRDHANPDETIGVLGLDVELKYLTGRRLVPLQSLSNGNAWKDTQRLPRRLMLTPMVGSYMYLSPSGYQWIEKNCVLEAQFGRYCFYRVTGPYPNDPAVLKMSVVHQPPAPLARPAWGG
jgi:hypothetical protein